LRTPPESDLLVSCGCELLLSAVTARCRAAAGRVKLLDPVPLAHFCTLRLHARGWGGCTSTLITGSLLRALVMLLLMLLLSSS
jgi:hypothetical protein